MMVDLNSVLAVLFGSGFLIAVIKLFLERRKRRLGNNRAEADIEAVHLSNDAHRLAAIGGSNKTIQGLLEESEANIKKMRETKSQFVAAQYENESLSPTLKKAKTLIDDENAKGNE